ncbi:MAG: hypothetical protein ACT4P4_00620 [Betaproteobacteria bacterium]
MRKTPIALALALALACGGVAAQSPASAPKPTAESASRLIESWPKTAKHTAAKMIAKYGAPNEATATQLTWFNNGPWKRTVVQKEEIDHKFPMPHKDVMEQVVDYKVSPEKIAEIAAYDGSVYVDRTRGEISARCDMEEANILAINLAHEIATGKRTVEDARKFYPQAVMAHLSKKPTPYTQKLQFARQSGTAFPDEIIVSKEEMQKAEALKQAMMKEDEQRSRAAAGGSKERSQR